MSNEDKYLDENLIQMKEEFEEYLLKSGNATTYKSESMNNTYVDPLVPRHTARFIYHNCNVLRRVITTYSQDILLNEYSLSDPSEDTDPIDETWNQDSNSWQLYLAGIEYFTYGYGALEVIEDYHGIRFQQIPAYTLRIKIEEHQSPSTGEDFLFFYAEQTINGKQVLLRLTNYDYTLLDKWGIEDKSEGECIWMGGCNENDFFDLPSWVNCYQSIFIVSAIDNLNYNKLEEGNIPAGLFTFQGPPHLPDPSDPSDIPISQQLEDTFKEKTSGVKFIYLQNASSERDITSEYYPLTDNNYDYLSQIRGESEEEIIRAYGIPKVRLLIDDTKESMNSNKSDTLYEIYTKNIVNYQRFFRQVIDSFNYSHLNVHSNIVISTPEFVDQTSTQITTILDLFNSGLLTLAQCLKLLNETYPEIDYEPDTAQDKELFETRFYNGNILGSTQADYDKMTDYDDIIDEVNSVLEEEDQGLLKRLQR